MVGKCCNKVSQGDSQKLLYIFKKKKSIYRLSTVSVLVFDFKLSVNDCTFKCLEQLIFLGVQCSFSDTPRSGRPDENYFSIQ